MVVLGLILLLAAVALVLLLATAGTSQDVVLDLVGGQQLTTSPVWVFVAGAVTLLLLGLGLLLIRSGTRRAVGRRREMRRLRAAARPTPGTQNGSQATHDKGPDVRSAHGAADRPDPADDAPDRQLVRDTSRLRPALRSPEEDVDPESGRHELRREDLEARDRRS